MKKVFISLFAFMLMIELFLVSLFLVYKIQNEKTLLNIRLCEQSASFYREEGAKAYCQAMLDKQEAERRRKQCYIDSYGEKMGLEYYDHATKIKSCPYGLIIKDGGKDHKKVQAYCLQLELLTNSRLDYPIAQRGQIQI